MVNEGGNNGGGRKRNRPRSKKKNKGSGSLSNPQSSNDGGNNSSDFIPPPIETPEEVSKPLVEEEEKVQSTSGVVGVNNNVAPENSPVLKTKKEEEIGARKDGKKEEKGLEVDLLKSLLEDDTLLVRHSYSTLQDAQQKNLKKPSDSEEIDLFASDEETTSKPKMVIPLQSKRKAKKGPKTSGAKSVLPEPTYSKGSMAAAPCNSSNSTDTCNEYNNPANGERTFIMLKPDAVQRSLIGEVIKRFESKGFKLIALKFMRASKSLLEQHYIDLEKKPFFRDLVEYMSSGPLVPMVWEGLDVVKLGRAMLGATNPFDSSPGTIRGDFCLDIGRNIIHGSDSTEAASKEISLWFSPSELTMWRSSTLGWLYEDEEELLLSTIKEAPISTSSNSSSLSAEIARARQHIKSSLEYVDGLAALAGGSDVSGKIAKLESDNAKLHKAVADLKNTVLTLQDKVKILEKTCGSGKSVAAAPATKQVEEDDDVDLFGSSSDEEEDAQKARVREERLKAYHEKKSKKPTLIAKTSVLLDVKPWDDETDMNAILENCKTIQKEGLTNWVPIGYGIKKLQVMCVVEDEKVSIDELCEQIAEFEDFVQSVDVAAMSKI
ncbi:ndk [Lepeophtheirus salmonis]|uniref:nucleoside-diphosphate kinase n=1 Tax=Lepeophtheirus salmonis TaxID=72036 RepID=A0A7R8HDR3_LEPSM|nr:ndk [Lepeophtheirus salmonis]CAF3039820.1 ndk [Lepeophtheirus salmonis]